MTTMIEKVAAAILKEQQNNRSRFPDNRDLARAAIEAMREPDKLMLDASMSSDWHPVASLSHAAADARRFNSARWAAMIDAILSEHDDHQPDMEGEDR